MRGVAVHDATGKPIRIIGSRIDITARRRAEAALEQSEERFRLATEALASVIYDWDPVRDREQLEEVSPMDTLLKMVQLVGESGLIDVENAVAAGRVGGAARSGEGH